MTLFSKCELYQAAKRDAEEAEAYAVELEAKLAKAVELAEAFDWAIAEIEGRTRYDTDEQRQNAKAEAINRRARFRTIVEGRE